MFTGIDLKVLKFILESAQEQIKYFDMYSFRDCSFLPLHSRGFTSQIDTPAIAGENHISVN